MIPHRFDCHGIAGLVVIVILWSVPVAAQNSSLLHAPGPIASVPTSAAIRPTQVDSGQVLPGLPLPMVSSPERMLPSNLPQPLQPGQVPALRTRPESAAPSLQGVSWTYQPAPPLRTFSVQDIVTIRVDEIARMTAEGEAEKRRNSLITTVLSDWIKLTRRGFVPDPQEEGDPTIAGQSQSTARAESSVESRESMTFNIAARVVDIRPNGNLVLEARKTYRVNDNLWETSLSGICRADDIGPDNVVLSRDLIDLEIRKEDRGHLRDGYARGWFQRMMDRIKPF